MSIDFFEKELKSVGEGFNSSFGMQDVCDLKSRGAAIGAIGSLGLIFRKIKKAKNKDDVRDEIKKFMRNKTILNSVFEKFENGEGERRDYDSANINSKTCSTG
jgi:hypothetical protein